MQLLYNKKVEIEEMHYHKSFRSERRTIQHAWAGPRLALGHRLTGLIYLNLLNACGKPIVVYVLSFSFLTRYK